MEELQDAIEDAQYINAMNDDSPKPTKQWTMPGEEVLAGYIERTRACNPEEMTLSYICSTPLGFYLVQNLQMFSIIDCSNSISIAL